MATDDAGGSSNAPVQNRYPTFKRDVFLSHSGKDKDFTGLLFERLTDRGYFPFFDSDPSDSLPPGQNASVANVLFDAVRECRVVIAILSEAFFTNSEWPMLELAAFVQSQSEELEKGKTIFPVFLGLTRDEVKDESRRKRWCERWSKMKVKEGAETRTGSGKPLIDTEQWEEALQVLLDQSGKYTTCEYNQASGLQGLLAVTVNALCGLVAPRDAFPDPGVQGRETICKAITEKIEELQSANDGVCIVGLHGMAGIGKTTFCKELCALKYCEFEGKVCYVELTSSDSGSSRESRVEANRKEVLRKLTHINPRDIGKNDLGRVREEKVFLALDNLKPEWGSVGEARDYLNLWRNMEGNGSVVIVTAQDIDTLVRVEIERSNCLEMPELREEDARSLFLWNAAPNRELKPEDDDDIRYCLMQCFFSKDGTSGNMHYHPLALKALGAQLRCFGPKPKIWKENLSKDDKFNQMREPNEHPIFRILRKGYDMLSDEDKFLFMDLALCRHQWRGLDIKGDDGHYATFMDWLLIVHHPRRLPLIKDGLQVLKERAVIVDIEGVSVHELYLKFARVEANRVAEDARRWVYSEGHVVSEILVKKPSGKCWANVERVCLQLSREVVYTDDHEADFVVDDEGEYFSFDRESSDLDLYSDGVGTFGNCVGDIEGIKWKYFSNVVVLDLRIYTPLDLDLSGLGRRLRILIIEVRKGKLVGLGKLSNLGWLELTGMHWASCAEDVISLKQLQVLRLTYYKVCETDVLDLENVKNCILLQEFVLKDCGGLKAFPDLSKMKNLRKVDIFRCNHPTELVLGLGPQRSKLEELWLGDCDSLQLIVGLEGCTHLQKLVLYYCKGLKAFPDLSKMESIRMVVIKSCNQPTELVLGLGPEHSKLEELQLRDCVSLQQIVGLESMTRLQMLNIYNVPELLELPQLAGLIALEWLFLNHLPKVQEFPDIRHLKKLRHSYIRLPTSCFCSNQD